MIPGAMEALVLVGENPWSQRNWTELGLNHDWIIWNSWPSHFRSPKKHQNTKVYGMLRDPGWGPDWSSFWRSRTETKLGKNMETSHDYPMKMGQFSWFVWQKLLDDAWCTKEVCSVFSFFAKERSCLLTGAWKMMKATKDSILSHIYNI